MSQQTELMEFISEDLLRGRPEISFEAQDDILGSGIVDSLGVMRIVAFIEERFDVTVPPEDVRLENFLSVNHIVAYLKSREDGVSIDN